MGQALSSCTRCYSGYENEDVDCRQKATSNEKNPQWKENIKNNKIALDMNPKSTRNHLYFTYA